MVAFLLVSVTAFKFFCFKQWAGEEAASATKRLLQHLKHLLPWLQLKARWAAAGVVALEVANECETVANPQPFAASCQLKT
jgi:hypothetical protein